jgi:hypothetical protein
MMKKLEQPPIMEEVENATEKLAELLKHGDKEIVNKLHDILQI